MSRSNNNKCSWLDELDFESTVIQLNELYTKFSSAE